MTVTPTPSAEAACKGAKGWRWLAGLNLLQPASLHLRPCPESAASARSIQISARASKQFRNKNPHWCHNDLRFVMYIPITVCIGHQTQTYSNSKILVPPLSHRQISRRTRAVAPHGRLTVHH